jgi:hypothetical protein
MKQRRGQSLVLAAVACLGLALGVLATVQMGRAVHQRIHVQNVADSAAYSVAAAQARSYNFWAFSNRAQITHYNAMMGLQAYVSYLYFIPYALASLSDSVYEASSIAASISCCYFLHGVGCCCIITWTGFKDCIPFTCNFALQAKNVMKNLRQGFEGMHNVASAADPVLSNLRRGVEIANRTLVPAANAAMFQSTQNFISSGKRRMVREMDADINREAVAMGIDLLLDRMNKTTFLATVEPTAMVLIPRGNNGEASRRIMSELANASRHDNFVTARKTSFNLFKIAQLGLIFGGNTSGQTKLISNGRISEQAANPVPEVTADNFDQSVAPVGDYLASEDTFRYGMPWWNFGLWPRSTGNFGTYVVAGPDGRKRKAWDPNPSWKACPSGLYRTSARRGNNYETIDDSPAFDGIAPFMRFAANADSALDFGQPSVYTFANKAARHIDPDGRSGPALEFRLNTPTRNVDFNSRIGAEAGLLGQLSGVNAISRAMTYYHRPGNWKEHPNFFNPFWRAKLAPIGQRFLANPLSGLLGGQIGTFMAESFMTH